MFELPELTYDYDALGDHISGEIMKLHHDKHHRGYVDKLNEAIEGTEYASRSVEDLLRSLDQLPDDIRETVRNNGGGHYNHSQFWQWMSPDGGGEPTGELAELIKSKYGSFQKFVDEFTTESLGVFGSGWCWLMPDASITTSPNQDSPLMKGEQAPILGLDVWEHAYYLDYKNHREDYVQAWWNVVDWERVEELFSI